MDSFQISFNAVAPMFCTIFLGMFFKKRGLLSQETSEQLNRIAFRYFIPILVFHNIYNAGTSSVFRPRLALFAAVSILVVYGVAWAVTMAVESRPASRGAMIQGMFRSNFALFGVPVVINLFGEAAAGIPSLLIAVVIPIYNILAVITLESFAGGNISPGKIVRGIVTNPLLVASLLGVASLSIQWKLPVFVEATIGNLAAVATPLSLVVMGASFHFAAVAKNKKQLVLVTCYKLLFVPAACLVAAICFGFRGMELASLLALYASPVAIASYPMAVQMKSDGDLAAGIVVATTLASCPTMFAFIWLLSHFALI